MKPKTAQQLMTDNLLCKHYAGSHAYGTSLPTSDVDFRGIFVADPLNIRTPFYHIEEVSDASEEDTKFYELNQFMKLTMDGNPNIVESLFVNESDVVYSTPAYELLRSYANELLSSKIAFTYSGYALSQLKRIKGHNKWINQPQEVKAPQQVDFISLVHNFGGKKMFKLNLHEYEYGFRLVPFSGDTYGLYNVDGYQPFHSNTGVLITDYEGDSHELGTPLFIIKFNREVYNAAKDLHANYWTWKKNRNEKRSELEEKYGYDTKHAMHLVRLLRTGAEALETGTIVVRRPDAEELLSIRNGSWSYEKIVEYAEQMDKHVRETLYHTTKLPKKPNIELAANLILQIQDKTWKME
jgi:predicted nucleotidyltransferase